MFLTVIHVTSRHHFLVGINVAGVKWVIRLQLVLLVVLFVAMLDFLIGSFAHTDPGSRHNYVFAVYAPFVRNFLQTL